jgi:hypothetical protein
MIRNDILCHKNVRTHPNGMVLLHRDLAFRVIEYMHTLLGNQGADKCMPQIWQSFELKKLEQEGEEACFAM